MFLQLVRCILHDYSLLTRPLSGATAQPMPTLPETTGTHCEFCGTEIASVHHHATTSEIVDGELRMTCEVVARGSVERICIPVRVEFLGGVAVRS